MAGRNGMTPVCFSCETTLLLTPNEISEQILEIANWTDFRGYGALPGIKAAEFEVRTPDVVGSRIRVQNTDGSSHIEEIIEWEPKKRLRLHMAEFSAPLSWLATGINETWEFEQLGDSTRVLRSFQLHCRSALTRPFLQLISKLLKRAVDRHLGQMRAGAVA